MTRRLDPSRAAALTTLAAGGVSALLGAVVGREGAVLGGLLATALVLVFFWTGAIPLLLVGGEQSRAGIGYLVLMMTYALRLVGLLVALTVAARSEAVDEQWLALSLIACTAVWVITQVALVGRSRSTL